MSKRDYESVAATIRKQVEQWPGRGTHYNMAYAIATELADVFEQDNRAFKRNLFLTACGFPLELTR